MAEKKMEEEFLTCSICYDVYKNPKTLSCLHRFCGKCLQNYIGCQKKSHLQKWGGFPCPVCRELIKSPNPQADPSEWANMLKTDFHLTNLIRFVEGKRTASVRVPSTKPKNACSVHKEKEIDLYCVDCKTCICHLCAGINHRGCNDVVTLQDVVSKQKAVIQKSLKTFEKSIQEITLNRERTLDRFEKLKSNAEVAIKKYAHQWHSAVEKEEQRLLQMLEHQCGKVYEKITPKLVEVDRTISAFNEKAEKFRNKNSDLSDYEVMNLFPNGMDLNSFGLSSYSHIIASIEKLNIKFKHTPAPEVSIGDLLFSSQIEPIVSASPPKQVEITNESGENTVYTIDNSEAVLYSSDFSQKDNPFQGLGISSSGNSSRRSFRDKLSRFIPSQFSTVSSEKKHQPQSVSQKTSHSNDNKTIPCIPEDTETENNEPSLHRPSSKERIGVQKLRTIPTRFRDDSTEPKLRDVMVITQGPTVIVTDWANQCVKAFFVRRDKDSRLEVGGRPWSITQLSDTSAAVSLPMTKQICILKTTSPLTMQKSFVAAKNYSGLATLNSQMLVASGGNDPPSVDIINLYGEILRSFSTSHDGSPLFMLPAYVCVTPAMYILVSDKKLGAVICMSHTGDIIYKFQPRPPKNLQNPCGLCTISSGHVIVLETRGILQLTPGGQMDHPLIRRADGHVFDPKGVAIDTEGLIYVTTDEQEVAVFKVSD